MNFSVIDKIKSGFISFNYEYISWDLVIKSFKTYIKVFKSMLKSETSAKVNKIRLLFLKIQYFPLVFAQLLKFIKVMAVQKLKC